MQHLHSAGEQSPKPLRPHALWSEYNALQDSPSLRQWRGIGYGLGKGAGGTNAVESGIFQSGVLAMSAPAELHYHLPKVGTVGASLSPICHAFFVSGNGLLTRRVPGSPRVDQGQRIDALHPQNVSGYNLRRFHAKCLWVGIEMKPYTASYFPPKSFHSSALPLPPCVGGQGGLNGAPCPVVCAPVRRRFREGWPHSWLGIRQYRGSG